MSAHGPRTTDGVREAVRDARVEAAVAVLIAVALLVANGLVSRWQGGSFAGMPWWAWTGLAVPEVLLLILLVVSTVILLTRLDVWPTTRVTGEPAWARRCWLAAAIVAQGKAS